MPNHGILGLIKEIGLLKFMIGTRYLVLFELETYDAFFNRIEYLTIH